MQQNQRWRLDDPNMYTTVPKTSVVGISTVCKFISRDRSVDAGIEIVRRGMHDLEQFRWALCLIKRVRVVGSAYAHCVKVKGLIIESWIDAVMMIDR